MAKNPKQPLITKKHLARQERERRQQRIIIIGVIVVAVLVIGVLLFGFINERFLKAQQPVAVVNGDNITTSNFQTRVRYNRQELIGRAINAYQIAQLFGDSPETQASFISQISSVQSQLNPLTVGQQTIDQMIDDELIQQEAERRGISISDQELDERLQSEFGFYPDGTPTATPTREVVPTSTLSPLQLTLIPPTSTPLPTQVITPTAAPTATIAAATATVIVEPSITPTSVPTLTPTPFTRELYEEQYQQTIDNLETNIGFNENDLRRLVRMSILREKVLEAVLAEQGIERTQEQVWARHILVPDEALANVVLQRLEAGEDWSTLAAELSTDTSNKDLGGDLGWFGRGRMVAEFEDAAFALPVGEISQPVQTEFGYHIIQVLGHENRPLSDSEYENLRQQRFAEWLQSLRDGAQVEERDWQDRVPEDPAFPLELAQYIQQFQNQALQTAIPPAQPDAAPASEQ